MDEWEALDLVLAQEVMSKIRLLARDPRDEDLIAELERWSGTHGGRLACCASLIADWADAIGAGQDVVHA